MLRRLFYDLLGNLLAGLVGGVVGGAGSWLVIESLKPDRAMSPPSSSVVHVDGVNAAQGKNSLRWAFELRPKRRFVFSGPDPVIASAHLTVRSNPEGTSGGLDLSGYKAVKFFAKASTGGLRLSEFNVFTGQYSLQYSFLDSNKLSLRTEWQEFYVEFDQMRLAPWEERYRRYLVPGPEYVSRPDLANVVSLGFDMKTETESISEDIWIDNIQLVARTAQKADILFDAEHITGQEPPIEVQFQGKTLVWVPIAIRPTLATSP